MATGAIRLPLALSILLGFGAALVACAAWVLLSYQTQAVWVYAGLVLGLAVGIAFNYRSEPTTWRVRSAVSVATTFISLFFSEYFLARQLAIDSLESQGLIHSGITVPLFMAPGSMIRVVRSTLQATPTSYAVWAFALYIAYAIPSASHHAARRRAKRAPQS